MLTAVRQGRLRVPTLRAVSLGVFLASALAGCTGLAPTNSRPVALVQGPPITDIFTPFDLALSCLNGQLRPDVTFSVGAILDQTGKDAITNGGSGKYISQGAGDMVQSALFRAGVTLLNRRDPRIMETEVKWGVRNPKTIAASNYFITGSINSLDFIPGGGLDVQVAGVGPQYSQTRIIVGLDLSLTDANTSRVVANVSLQKQIAAQDYGINAGRFAGITLLNVQIGAGEREATNFALRQMLNLATFELLNQVMDPSSYVQCRERIPPEYGSLNLTRSAVRLGVYKRKQEMIASTKQKQLQLQADPDEPIAVIEQSVPSRPPVKPVVAPGEALVPPAEATSVSVGRAVPARTAVAKDAADATKAEALPVKSVQPVPATPVVEQAKSEPAKTRPVAAVPTQPVHAAVQPKSVEAASPAISEAAPVAAPAPVATKPVAVAPQPVPKAEKAPVSAPALADDVPVAPPVKAVVNPEDKAVVTKPVALVAPASVQSQDLEPARPDPSSRKTEVVEDKPASQPAQAPADSLAKLAKVKPAQSPAPESLAEQPGLVKPSAQVKSQPAAAAATKQTQIETAPAARKPVASSKPSVSPVPEPLAKNKSPVAPSSKPQSKPSLLEGEWSAVSAEEAPGKPAVQPSREKEKMAGTARSLAKPTAKVAAEKQSGPSGLKPVAQKATKPALEAKPSYAQITSKSNTVAFVSSDDDGGKYWSDESVEDVRNSPIR